MQNIINENASGEAGEIWGGTGGWETEGIKPEHIANDNQCQVAWSEFNHCKDNYPKNKRGAFDDLADLNRNPVKATNKDGKAFCPAIFNGKVRTNAAATDCSFLAFDLDGLPEGVTAGDVLPEGLQAFAYSSHSHLLPGKGARFRVVVAVDKPIPAELYRGIASAFAARHFARWPAATDGKCFNPSRIFYFASCSPDRVDLFEFEEQDGTLFDWQDLDHNIPLPHAGKPLAGASSMFGVMPSELVSIFGNAGNLPSREIAEGGRNDGLFRVASAMRGQGMELDEIAGELMQKNQELCKPPLDPAEVLTIAESVCKYPAGAKSGTVLPAEKTAAVSLSDPAGVTELAMAKAIAQAFGGRFHYVAESGKFYHLPDDSGLWVEDYSGWVNRQFFDLLNEGKELAFSLIRERNESGNKLLSAILKAERHNFVTGSIALLKALPGITIRASTFDSNPLLVGFLGDKCANLRTGEVRQIRADDYLTKTLGTHFDPLADCPIWKKSIAEWTRNDSALAKFLQVLVGYALSGLTEVQALFFLYGGGANGKSVFIKIVNALFGDYAKTLDSDSLMAKANGNQTSNDLARIAGARLLTTSELPEGKVFDENRLKNMTGGDRITARFLYGEHFEFVCEAVLIISGNHKPIVRGNDNGIWRRIHLVPFLASVENPDPELASKLLAELPGILNWALVGWKMYQKEGLIIPESIKMESASYRSEMDIVGQWLDQKTAPMVGNKVKKSDFFASFKEWTIENGFHGMNSSAFGRKLEGRINSIKSNGVRYYVDVKMVL